MNVTDPIFTGEIFEEMTELSVEDLTRLCAVDRAHMMELIHEGVLDVVQLDSSRWRFSGAALRRARTALRLERELELNLAGVALALDLMEQLEQLRRELNSRNP